MTTSTPLSLLWLASPGSRPGREPSWLAAMPTTDVDVVGEAPTGDAVTTFVRPYRRLTNRFTEAGALAWLRDLASVPDRHDWIGALELCALVTAQAQGLARARHRRFFVLTWGNDPRHPLYRLPPYASAVRRARDADLVVCLIGAARDHCVAMGFDPDRCAVVYPPLDTDHFCPPTHHQSEPIAVFVSPLTPNKGVDRVLAAFAAARRAVPEARLRIVGRGPQQHLVEAAAAADPHIEYLGALDRAAVADVLRSSAVFVTAPRANRVWNEQFGMAYVEAQACGLPVVTTACGTNWEAVAPPNLVVADDPDALADALAGVLADPERRETIGRTNRAEMVRRFAFDQQITALRAAFEAHV